MMMSHGYWLVFLALAALAQAAVMPLDKDPPALPNETTTKKNVTFCAPETPCAWTFYNVTAALTKIVNLNLSNSYCTCAPGKICIETEDDTSSNTIILRCRTEADAAKLMQHTDNS